ncbi:MFS transporter [Dialister hominis]|jgi:benzoate transport|uniref:MFS transporter n=1 Tax=Dialister TaxID=39948 RepID=UPI000335D5E4|nr:MULTISPECIES: MFS transporter [environmental samples]MBP6060266.1 MFS transporter [Dialister sp.]MCH3930384.1 MFS transporter [Dialister sp.]CDD79881.1 aromatic acid:H+ symporter (AAHS) family MFS transporter [Dialister sp. CAG:357]
MSQKTIEELEFEETGVTRKERWKIMWASIIGYAMDGLDVLILSFAMAAIVSEFGLTLGEGGMIATYTLIGTVLGGYIFGIFADWWGRVHTFSLTIIIFSIFTGACAFADNAVHLDILRFLAGLGLGGEYGIGMTLVSETWPGAKRARATAGVAMGWQAGAVLAAILAAVVLPDYGWRGLFLVGVLPALLAAWARHGIKEPPMWVKRKEMKKALQARKDAGEKLTAEEEEQLTEAKKFPLAHLFADKKTTITTIALTIMTSVQNFGYYGIMVWLPMILLKEHGLTTKSMSGWMIVTVIGMIAGIFVFGWLCDRLGRKKPYLLFYVCAAAMVYIYVNLGTPIALLFGGAFLGFFCNGMMAGYGTLLSENYTTDARSTAQNFIFNTGRAVGGFAPVIIGTIAQTNGFNTAFVLLSAVYLAAAVNVLFFVKDTKGTVIR